MSRSLANRILIGWAVLGVAASIALQVLNLLGFSWISDISLAIIRRYTPDQGLLLWPALLFIFPPLWFFSSGCVLLEVWILRRLATRLPDGSWVGSRRSFWFPLSRPAAQRAFGHEASRVTPPWARRLPPILFIYAVVALGVASLIRWKMGVGDSRGLRISLLAMEWASGSAALAMFVQAAIQFWYVDHRRQALWKKALDLNSRSELYQTLPPC